MSSRPDATITHLSSSVCVFVFGVYAVVASVGQSFKKRGSEHMVALPWIEFVSYAILSVTKKNTDWYVVFYIAEVRLHSELDVLSLLNIFSDSLSYKRTGNGLIEKFLKTNERLPSERGECFFGQWTSSRKLSQSKNSTFRIKTSSTRFEEATRNK